MQDALFSKAKDLPAILEFTGATGVTASGDDVYLEYGRVSILESRAVIKGSENQITPSILLEDEKRDIIRLVNKVVSSSARIVLIGGRDNAKRAHYLEETLRKLNKKVNKISVLDMTISNVVVSDVDYVIVTSTLNSIADFTLMHLSDRSISDMFTQLFNASLFSVRVPALCTSCKKLRDIPDKHKSNPRKGFTVAEDKAYMPNIVSCDDCVSGYSGTHVICEFLSCEDNKLLDCISKASTSSKEPSYKRLINDLHNDNVKTVYTVAENAVKQGVVSVEDVFRTVL